MVKKDSFLFAMVFITSPLFLYPRYYKNGEITRKRKVNGKRMNSFVVIWQA